MVPRLAVVLLLLAAAPASGQAGRAGLGALRDTLALAPGQTAVQLPEGVIPASLDVFVLRGAGFEELAADGYTLDPATSLLRLTAAADTLVVLALAYRRLPPVGAARVRLPPLDSLRAAEAAADTSGARPARTAAPGLATPDAPPGAGIETTGTISRGVVAGSARDASITSGLRLALRGEVAPGVSIRAALTDESTPILPEGTTTRLADLDRVFVAVESARARAQLGDIDLRLDGTTFAPLARTVQGALAEADLPAAGPLVGGRVTAVASATRGQFRSQTLAVREGVQGPYRLTGALGEAFVVVVPGSDRVTLDGRPLARGAGYTIDYALGEITLTPAVLATAELRLVVDFEYTTGGFTRTLTAADATASFWPGAAGPRATLGARVLREADATGFATQLGLSESDLDAIAAAGNADVLVPSAERVPFDPESPFVLYARRDTVVNGAPTQIFVPATAADPEVFRVRFSRVEPGRGDYRRAGQARNGLLHEYAGPGQGDAIPFRVLPRPAARRVLDLRARAAPLDGLEVFGEVAHAADDANTLSALGDGPGAAAVEAGVRLADLPVPLGTLSGGLVRRVRADAFRTLDRPRDVDFSRRWNLTRGGSPLDAALDTLGEALTEGALRWVLATGGSAEVEGGVLRVGGLRSTRGGARATLGAADGRPLLSSRVDVARTSGDGLLADRLGTGRSLRAEAAVQPVVGIWRPRLAGQAERRAVDRPSAGADTLVASSYAFWAARPGLGVEVGALRADADAEWRVEQEPLGPVGATGPLADAARVWTVETSADLRGRRASADARVALRQRTYTDAFRALGRQDGQSAALRLAARAAPGLRALEAQASYDAVTERSPVLQETYVLVGPEFGTHVWRDGQGEARAGEPDGVPQIDEFFPETTPLEGAYLRTFIPSEALFPTVGVGLTARLGLRPGRLALGDGRLARALRAVELRTVLDLREKTREADVLRVLLLDPGALQQRAEGGTLSGRFRAEQELVVFPDAPRAGGRLAVQHLTTTSRLAAGLETRLQQSVRAEGHGPLGPALALRVETVAERRRAESSSFASRSYDLRSVGVEPRLTWTPSARWRVQAGAVLTARTDAQAAAGRPTGADLLLLPAEVRLALDGRLAASARVEHALVRLRGDGGGGLALFELTDGRGPGASTLWGVSAQLGMADGLRGSVVYEGRAPAAAPVLHTVRMQVTATL